MIPPSAKANWVSFLPARSPVEVRLYCFPHAGGGAVVFAGWPLVIDSGIQVCPVLLPGREGRLREPAYVLFRPLIESLADALQSHLQPPYALFGHSMGALIAFELTRELRRRGRPLPARLFVSAARAPQRGEQVDDFRGHSQAEFIAEMQNRYGGIPQQVLANAEMTQLLLPTLRADFALMRDYAYADDAPLACPITAFGGAADTEVGPDDLQAWREQTHSGFTVQMFPGDHFYLKQQQADLLRSIADDLREYPR